jgi:broad specificity phosphatase PhoE
MTQLARLVLVRHGETVGNSRVRYYGRTDLELSELGRAQMRATARRLATHFGAGIRFNPIVSSSMRRALEGARIIGGATAEIVEIEEFREVDFGKFEGHTAEEIALLFPSEFARWNRDRLTPDFTYPGGESRAAFAARVERGLDRMLRLIDVTGNGNPALLVAHRGVVRAITRQLAGVEPLIELGSIQILAHGSDSRWHAEQLDFSEHLARLV